MADVERQTEGWESLPWKAFQRNVFRLQKRIYQASARGDFKCVRNLQRLLLRSFSARCLAVRQVTQDNRGKRTPGIDGVASLEPAQRIALVRSLQHLEGKADPIRRVYIPKPNSEEKRPLGIPTMADRARQALVKLALEPEWEARFEPNSYGFRPGRSAHDAREAIFSFICRQPKYVLDADIEKCFDKIAHDALVVKLSTIPVITRLVKSWLKAGVWEKGQVFPTEAGTPQGGVISPLLMNVALHGLETALVDSIPSKQKPAVIRYADDLVILHPDLATIQSLQAQTERWLAQMGLNLKPNKTRITHTLHPHEGQVGFDFLGFTVRQFPVGKYRTSTYRGKAGFKTLIKPSKQGQKRHLQTITELIHRHCSSDQTELIAALNPKIRGWTMYYRTSVAKRVFNRLDNEVNWKLRRWARRRHPNKNGRWRQQRYWHHRRGRLNFSDGRTSLVHYTDTKIVRHTKVRGAKSPFDGNWLYWVPQLGRDPTKPDRVVKLLKRQKGKCNHCGLHFMADDVMEVHHKHGNQQSNLLMHLELLHGHCHDEVHRTRYR